MIKINLSRCLILIMYLEEMGQFQQLRKRVVHGIKNVFSVVDKGGTIIKDGSESVYLLCVKRFVEIKQM